MGVPVTEENQAKSGALDAVCLESGKAEAQKRQIGDMLEGTPEEEKPTPVKKRKKKDAIAPEAPEIVLVDGGEPQVRTWRICSENRVNVRKSMAHDSESLRHLPSGAEFEAEGPYKIAKKGCHAQWLKLSGEDSGFVCTCSSKDASKVVATLKRKQSAESQEATVQVETNIEYALLIKPDWCRQIFEKGKVWEIRGEACHRRGRFAIAASSTGTLVGEATMINSLKVGKFNQNTGKLKRWNRQHKKSFIGRKEHFQKHRIADLSIVKYPKVFAWVLDDVVRYKKPVPYKHPQGAVKWVKLDEVNTAEAEGEDAGYHSSSNSQSSSSSSSSSSSRKPSHESSKDTMGEEAARVEVARLAEEQAARVEADRSVAEEAARVEAARLAEVARVEAARLAEEEAARVEAARLAEEEAARVEAVRLAAEEAARVEAARLAADPACRLVARGECVGDSEKLLPASPSAAARKPDAGDSEKAVRRLQKAVSTIETGPEESLLKDLLKWLLGPGGSLGSTPAKVLAESKAGFVVAKLKKLNPSEDVRGLAAQLITRWRELVNDEKSQRELLVQKAPLEACL